MPSMAQIATELGKQSWRKRLEREQRDQALLEQLRAIAPALERIALALDPVRGQTSTTDETK